MSIEAVPAVMAARKPSPRRLIVSAAVLVLLVAMALDTKVVKIGSPADVQPGVFSPPAFGASEFPKVRAAIEGRAVDAPLLAAAIAKDAAAAATQYGIAAAVGPEMSVKFTGVAGKAESGVYTVAVEGVPSDVAIRLQTGPAINGMDLRDATGTISFGQFVNQIDYQNAGSALNKEMKKQVLAKIDPKALGGRTIAVVGAFKLVNPNNWLITPVTIELR